MTTKRIQTIVKIFNKTTSSKQIHEGVLFVENTNGDFSYSKGYGGKDVDSPLLMASITKLFTTTCILALQEKGELSLDDRLTKYFDNVLLSNIHVNGGKDYSFELTLSDLLFQVSGLPDVFEEGKDSAKSRAIEEDYYTTFSEQVVLVKNLKPHFAPRTKRKAYYADINFDMLGEIIEKATNTILAEAYKKYIFERLALESTYLPEHENDFIPNIYYKDQSIYRPQVIRSSRASGGCITTARELMTFMKAFFGGKLFNKELFEKLPASNKLQASMGPIYYGSGYMRIPLDGLITLFMGKGELMGHSGSTGSFAFYYPVKDLFMVGDLNQMGNAALPIRLSMKLAMTTNHKKVDVMENISSLIEKLSWSVSEEEKEDAIHKLQNIKEEDLHLLLQPISKDYWDGAAETVLRLGYPRVKSILSGLLEWIQDRNWPGAGQIGVFLLEIGDPMIPYVKDVLNQHSDDQEWVYWIFEVLINHWNTVQVLQIQAELIKISQEKANDLSALRILLTHGIYAKDVVCEIIQCKKDVIAFDLKELHDTHPEIDCEALKKEFNEIIIKQPNLIKSFYEHNKERFFICNAISDPQEYLSEIEIFTAEFLTS